jgi:hypothetical protein
MYKKLWSDEVEARIRKEARNLDPQTPPKEVVRCSRCVMTNQRPRIEMYASGVDGNEPICSACRYHERQENEIDWEARGEEFCDLLDRYRGRKPYDVIVPSSGGKDSSFVAITLRGLGMTPLAACWAPHIYTDIGIKNIQSFIHSGFDVVTAQPNGLLHRKLSRLALEFYGDPFLPFIYGQLCWGFHVARQNLVDLVFFGENGEALYGGDPSAADKPCWDESDWERVYMKGGSFDRVMSLGVELGAISVDERERASPFYTMPEYEREYYGGFGPYVEERPQFYWMPTIMLRCNIQGLNAMKKGRLRRIPNTRVWMTSSIPSIIAWGTSNSVSDERHQTRHMRCVMENLKGKKRWLS